MKVLKVFTTIPLLLACVAGGFIFYQYLTVGGGIDVLIAVPFFILLSIIACLIPLDIGLFSLETRLNGLRHWLVAMPLIIVLLWAYDWARNLSPTLLSADYYLEQGLQLHFRENGTYKAIESDGLTGKVYYGRYQQSQNHFIIKSGQVNIGSAVLEDTLTLLPAGLAFELEEEWRGIVGDTMQVLEKE